MKILLINPMPLAGSGSGVYTENIANALVRKGHEVCCIFVENEKVQQKDYQFKIHPIYFQTKELPYNFPCFTAHPRSDFNFRDLSDEQLASYTKAFKDAIADEVQDFQPDVIHSGHIWLSSQVAADFNIPLVITCHGTDLYAFQKSKRFRADAKKAAQVARSIICISEQNIHGTHDCFPDTKDKTVLMPNGYIRGYLIQSTIVNKKF